MSKELTEQWKDGELENGYYYIIPKEEKYGNILIDKYKDHINDCGHEWRGFDNCQGIVKEVLAPVPSYEEYQDILQQNVNQESAIETYIEQIKHLQEQLDEANKVISHYAEKNGYMKAIEYLNKWSVK